MSVHLHILQVSNSILLHNDDKENCFSDHCWETKVNVMLSICCVRKLFPALGGCSVTVLGQRFFVVKLTGSTIELA